MSVSSSGYGQSCGCGKGDLLPLLLLGLAAILAFSDVTFTLMVGGGTGNMMMSTGTGGRRKRSVKSPKHGLPLSTVAAQIIRIGGFNQSS